MASCLRICGLSLGYLQLILKIALVVLLSIALYDNINFQDDLAKKIHYRSDGVRYVNELNAKLLWLAEKGQWVLTSFLLLLSVGILTTISLLYGIVKRRESFIVVWLIWNVIVSIANGANLVYNLLKMFQDDPNMTTANVLITATIMGFYFWIIYIMNLLYQEIKEENGKSISKFHHLDNHNNPKV